MIWSTHGISICIGKYLGVSCSNLLLVVSKRLCPTNSWRVEVYIDKRVTLVTEVFSFIKWSLFRLFMLATFSEGLYRPDMNLCLAYMSAWWCSPDCIVFLIGCVPLPCLVCLFCWGVFHHPGQYWSYRPSWGVSTNEGAWWPLVNLLRLLCRACLVLPCCYLLLREILLRGYLNGIANARFLAFLLTTGCVNHPLFRTDDWGTTWPEPGAFRNQHDLLPP